MDADPRNISPSALTQPVEASLSAHEESNQEQAEVVQEGDTTISSEAVRDVSPPPCSSKTFANEEDPPILNEPMRAEPMRNEVLGRVRGKNKIQPPQLLEIQPVYTTHLRSRRLINPVLKNLDPKDCYESDKDEKVSGFCHQ